MCWNGAEEYSGGEHKTRFYVVSKKKCVEWKIDGSYI